METETVFHWTISGQAFCVYVRAKPRFPMSIASSEFVTVYKTNGFTLPSKVIKEKYIYLRNVCVGFSLVHYYDFLFVAAAFCLRTALNRYTYSLSDWVPGHKIDQCHWLIMRHFDLDSVLWCNQWCTLGLAAFRCQAVPHQRHPHPPSPWTSTHLMLVLNTLSSMPIAIVCRCRTEDWPIDAYLRRQPNLIADLAMDCSWNSVSHPTYCNDTASNQPALFNHRQKWRENKKIRINLFWAAQQLRIYLETVNHNWFVWVECANDDRMYSRRSHVSSALSHSYRENR